MRRPREQRDPRPRDVRARRRRRARDARRRPARLELLRDSFVRLRAADGFSHARSLAFTTSLVLVQGLIVLVGLATASATTRSSARSSTRSRRTVPGPASNVLTRPSSSRRTASAATTSTSRSSLGLVGLLITSATAMGQFERSLNRLYGIEQDRPTLQKYGRAFVLAVTAGDRHRHRLPAARVRARLIETGSARCSAGRSRSCWSASGSARSSATRRTDGSRRGRGSRSAPASPSLLWTIATLLLALAFRAQLELRRHVRPARGHRGAPALDAPLRVHDPLRRRGHGAARGRPRRRDGAAPGAAEDAGARARRGEELAEETRDVPRTCRARVGRCQQRPLQRPDGRDR